ncbi:hypothetical protein F2P56_012499 [Juglans regia]|uniref:Uncharacterized protein n=1 Tax=Juglans regia TaxID=51240 RepID=A0A833XIY8_JUGRE|nr:hypothetical protein F2P56_012499 [Juglans regia]
MRDHLGQNRDGVRVHGLAGHGGRRRRGGGRRSTSGRARALGDALAGATTDGDVAKGAALGPIAAAGLAEVAGLGEVVVVVVAELGGGGTAARARERLSLRWWRVREALLDPHGFVLVGWHFWAFCVLGFLGEGGDRSRWRW